MTAAQDAFEEMIKDFMEALMQEIVKSIAMMGIGAATSAALWSDPDPGRREGVAEVSTQLLSLI
jgi:hypothetical protein